jgi:hypothetical protein
VIIEDEKIDELEKVVLEIKKSDSIVKKQINENASQT